MREMSFIEKLHGSSQYLMKIHMANLNNQPEMIDLNNQR